ncbi:hypothetical protein COO60DRAFT_1517832 [Scenedesmus sp. NREL 46B-D3]|nr:hypothetical protein COO60DRAFT_1517832 [Scenedesmus sp. NREL 46B-D3]
MVSLHSCCALCACAAGVAGLLSGLAAAGQVLPVTMQYLLVEEQQQLQQLQHQEQQQLQQQEQQATDDQHQQQQGGGVQEGQKQQQQRRPLPAGLAEQLQLAGALLRLVNSATLWWPGKLLLGNTFSAVVGPACSMAEAVLVCSERRRTSSSSSSSWSEAELAALTTAEALCSALMMEGALPPRSQHTHALAASMQLQYLLMVLLASAVQAVHGEAAPATAVQPADADLATACQLSSSPGQPDQVADTQQQQQAQGQGHQRRQGPPAMPKYHEALWGALDLPPLARNPQHAAACRSAFCGHSAADVAVDVAQVLYNTVLYRSEVAARSSSMRAGMQDEAEQQQQQQQQVLEVVPSVMMVPLLLTCIELQQLSPGFGSVETCTRLACAVHHLCSHSYAGASEHEVQAAALTATVTADLLVRPFLLELAPTLLQAIQATGNASSSGRSGGAAAEAAGPRASTAGLELLMPRQAQLFRYYQALLCEVLLAARCLVLLGSLLQRAPAWPVPCMDEDVEAMEQLLRRAAIIAGWIVQRLPAALPAAALEAPADACSATAAAASAADGEASSAGAAETTTAENGAAGSSTRVCSSILQQLQRQAGELQVTLGQAIQWSQPPRPLDGSTPAVDNSSSSSWGSKIGQAVRSLGDMFGEKAAEAALAEARERVSGPAAQQVLAFGLAVCGSVPARSCCNNALCANTARLCESHLVSGKSCRCAGCNAAYFCCKSCQLASWKHHKTVCKAMQQQREAAR